MNNERKDSIIVRNIEEEMKESYLRYSMSVIISRALPDVRDGLKPSQRRILYAMRLLNLSPQSKHRKCAKICGDTSGDFHPHGEQVIYPTLVRMAQSWAMRYRLIDGQGNFGSIDGDMPAAMRYTEARLTQASLQLMEDLDKETVDFVSNYDETKKEPVVFPSKFPNLLSNGSTGIAVGMATNIPPHNLGELIQATLLVLENPLVSYDEIMRVMPGPDFPTGGKICGFRGIKEAYHTGRGKLYVRATIHVEENPDNPDKPRLIVSEIPYNIQKSRLIEQIADLINEKTLTTISDIRDESDREGMRICIELKKGEIPEVTINQLYKFTDLQNTFGCNMLALDKGLPQLMTIRQMISLWIDHRIEVIRRRSRFELAKAEARSHILEGYLKAVDHLDDVVKIVRSSSAKEEAKNRLKELFAFSEKQALAVLDLRLYQLTALEREKIEDEQKALLLEIAELRAILASESKVKEIIRTELEEIYKVQKSPRKTEILPHETEMNMEDLIANEQVIITISEDDYIKRMPIDTFREQKRGGVGVVGLQLKKELDVIKGLYVVSTHDILLIFTTLGRVYWLKGWQVPEFGRNAKGKPLVNLLEDIREGEKIATCLHVTSLHQEGSRVFFATRNGTVKKSDLSEFSNPRRKGVTAIELDDSDELVATHLVHEGEMIMLFTYKGMAVRFDESEVRSMGRSARGVRGVSLRDKEDYVVNAEVVKGDETVLVVCENGFGKRSSVDDFRKTHRGGVGVKSIITSERNGNVVKALCVQEGDSLLMMSSKGLTLRTAASDLRILGRNTQGVKLVNLKEDDTLIVVQKIRGVAAEVEGESAPVEPLVGESEAVPQAVPEADGS